MSEPAGKAFLLRLFPLPNLVFFPNTRLPLHIFEPRYKQLVSDALASSEPIGMVLLRSGWESNYYGAPPIHSHGTLGVIEQVVRFEDGRYNLLLNGQTRFRIVEETASSPYRTARVLAVPETAADPDAAYAQREWLVDLSRRYLSLLPGQTEVPELDTANLESLTNALVMALNLDTDNKQKLLEIDEMLSRAKRVGELLEERLERMEFLHPYRRPSGDPQQN